MKLNTGIFTGVKTSVLAGILFEAGASVGALIEAFTAAATGLTGLTTLAAGFTGKTLAFDLALGNLTAGRAADFANDFDLAFAVDFAADFALSFAMRFATDFLPAFATGLAEADFVRSFDFDLSARRSRFFSFERFFFDAFATEYPSFLS